jgi:hypothetical protein
LVTPKIQALAAQLYFVATETDHLPEGDDPPPVRWSPLRAKAYFESASEAVQEKWIEYAKKVAPFAGVEGP